MLIQYTPPIPPVGPMLMSDERFLHQIRFQLRRLKLPQLLPSLEVICGLFKNFPFIDPDHAPAPQILSVLREIEQMNPSATLPEASVLFLVRVGLAKMECWTYRAAVLTDRGRTDYWNPIELSYSDYCEQHEKEELFVCQADCEYPPADLIRAWLRSLESKV